MPICVGVDNDGWEKEERERSTVYGEYARVEETLDEAI